jgi:urea transport system ATP-binding protein
VHNIARIGIGRTFQTTSVFEKLTVLQNLDIAAGAGRRPLSLLRRRSSTPPEVEETLEAVNLSQVRHSQAGALPHGQKQWLEIGMLVQNARVLLLDEPVAGVSSEERTQTGELLRRVGTKRTAVVVEHDMEFIRSFATSGHRAACRTGAQRGHRGPGAGGPEGPGRSTSAGLLPVPSPRRSDVGVD